MSATAQTLKAPRQQSLPLPVRIESVFSPRGISAASLRPGDFLRFKVDVDQFYFVVQSSAKLRKVELEEWPTGERRTCDWEDIAHGSYLGQGRRRWWWPLLPELARKYVSEFSRP